MAIGGRPTHRRAAPHVRAEEITAGFIRRCRGRDAARVARTAIEVAACQQRDLVRDQIVFDLRIPVQPADRLLPPGQGILVKVDAGQLPESVTAEI
jgi:hypothetical protein